MELSEGVKERLGVVVGAVQTGFHWGFVPLVLYLGEFWFMFFCPSARGWEEEAVGECYYPTLILSNLYLHRLYEGS